MALLIRRCPTCIVEVLHEQRRGAGSEADQDELLRGQMSPDSTTSSNADLLAYDKPVGLAQRHSTPTPDLQPFAEGGPNSQLRLQSDP